ncbi:hypothetical protein ACFE04_003860 [Oxalis oulophora]
MSVRRKLGGLMSAGGVINISDSMGMVVPASATPASTEIECAKCECCDLVEECTPAYIEKVGQRYNGKWICGLCAEAIKEEFSKSHTFITTEEAMARHMSFCKKFNPKLPPIDPASHLISAMRQLLRKGLHSPRGAKSTPNTPTNNRQEGKLERSESCFSSMSS